MSELNSLANRHYAAGDLTRKPLTYLVEYERILAASRETTLRVLELGVSSGASLLMWRDYLPHATIVGIDIDNMPRNIAGQDRIRFIQASQDDTIALDQAGELAGGPFDLIIDDASHIGYLTKRSFLHLFANLLKPGGTYAIEDFFTGFRPECLDGSSFVEPSAFDTASGTRSFESHQFGMVGVIKQMIDLMARELMTGQHSYLSIEKITIPSNLALIEKASRAAGPPPSRGPGDTGVLGSPVLGSPVLGSPGEDIAALGADIRRLHRRVTDLESADPHGLRQRVSKLEVVLDRFFTNIRWLRQPWRMFRGSGQPK